MVSAHFLKDYFFIPLFYSGAKALGTEALKTSANILTDIAQRKPKQ
jgi:hypothetical protein